MRSFELQLAADQEADDPQGEVVQGFDRLHDSFGDQPQAAFADEQADEDRADDLRNPQPPEDPGPDGPPEYGDARSSRTLRW